MIFIKNFQILELFFSICIISFNFSNVFTAPKNLKGSRNIQGFALLRAVLYAFIKDYFSFRRVKIMQSRTVLQNRKVTAYKIGLE